MDRFVITRNDGRSNAEVLVDLVKGAQPGRVFDYGEIAEALDAGTNRRHSRQEVQRIVTASTRRVLKDAARALHAVRNVGYRLAPAAYHVELSDKRKAKADKQLLIGLDTLRHVKWDEMSDNERKAHEGHLMITSALVAQMQQLSARQTKIERAIAKVTGKVEG